jgi:hypothetical protein
MLREYFSLLLTPTSTHLGADFWLVMMRSPLLLARNDLYQRHELNHLMFVALRPMSIIDAVDGSFIGT